MKKTGIPIVLVVLLVCGYAQTQVTENAETKILPNNTVDLELQKINPCSGLRPRALVMGGGGSKGAFAVGAAYHTIVHRGCDFTEISGNSAGALNGVILAQAGRSNDGSGSQANLAAQAEELVELWQTLDGGKKVYKNRFLGSLRFAIFGAESMKDFRPLYDLLQDVVVPERLAEGREFRVGTVSFHDGEYREVVLNKNGVVIPNSVDYVLASSVLPMVGKMPRISINDGENFSPVQFGDGSLRHIVPVEGYFRFCTRSADSSNAECLALGEIPPHPPIQQLFVIVNNPFHRGSYVVPAEDNTFERGTRQITDGRKVLSRATGLLMNTIYSSDLESLVISNELLRWREEYAQGLAQRPELWFPVESYNYDPSQPTASSHPYEIAMIAPPREDGDMSALLDFSPERISRQLYCGCISSDAFFQSEYGLESLAPKCSERFQRSPATKKPPKHHEFTPADCGFDPAASSGTNRTPQSSSSVRPNPPDAGTQTRADSVRSELRDSE